MLTIGLGFCSAHFVGLSTSTSGPGRHRCPGDVVHLECLSSIDEQAWIVVGELVFVRAKFMSEGVGFSRYHFRKPRNELLLKTEEKLFGGGEHMQIRDHTPIPPLYQEATTCSVRKYSRLNKGHITNPRY